MLFLRYNARFVIYCKFNDLIFFKFMILYIKERMRNNMKSGFVSIVGRANTGKSTLLDSILQKKVAITSSKPNTTRNIIQGIYNEKDCQIVFVDSPGISSPKNKLGKLLNKQALSLLDDVDAVVLVVDGTQSLGPGDRYMMNALENKKIPVILAINKIDKLDKENILKKIYEYKDEFSFAEIVPVSALTNDNVDRLIEVIKKYLTDNVKYFEDDIYTTNSINFMISEFVREKLLDVCEQEIPHKITCNTIYFEEKKDIVECGVDIIVDRDSLKKIIIGKKGSRLKDIGIKARIEIEEMLGKKVFLELHVKTVKNWLDKEKYLDDLGFKNF